MPMEGFSFKDKVKFFLISRLAVGLMRLWFGTVRVTILDPEIYGEYFKQHGEKMNVVAASWHRHAIFLFYFFRRLESKLIMISRSRDGEITTGIARNLGYTIVRGSSSKGGGSALTELIRFMQSGPRKYLCGTPVDGPRGPARTMKKGMMILARETDAWFIPMTCSGNRVVTLGKSWDHTILPLPFSRMTVGFGQPRKIPSDIDDEGLEKLRVELEKELNELTDRVDKRCGYLPR